MEAFRKKCTPCHLHCLLQGLRKPVTSGHSPCLGCGDVLVASNVFFAHSLE